MGKWTASDGTEFEKKRDYRKYEMELMRRRRAAHGSLRGLPPRPGRRGGARRVGAAGARRVESRRGAGPADSRSARIVSVDHARRRRGAVARRRPRRSRTISVITRSDRPARRRRAETPRGRPGTPSRTRRARRSLRKNRATSTASSPPRGRTDRSVGRPDPRKRRRDGQERATPPRCAERRYRKTPHRQFDMLDLKGCEAVVADQTDMVRSRRVGPLALVLP